MKILIADDLFRFFHPGDTEVRALRGASLSVRRGETVALVGPSGSGKSTLLACIAGLDQPDGGSVTIDGHRMTRISEAERAARRAASIGFLAQSGNLFAHLSVAGNIALQMDLRGVKPEAARISALLQMVGLAERGDALPETLSGGEAARAGLAVALAGDPPLLIADEPTAEVDAVTEAFILDVLEQRRARGGAALIATHSRRLGESATRILAIADGRIVETGRPPDLPHCPAERPAAPLPRKTLLIETRGAARMYDIEGRHISAVQALDCQIFAGQRLALMGRSGSGKSTLLNLLAGLEEPSAGEISWPGLDLSQPLRPHQIGFVFQSPSLISALNVVENLRLPLEIAELAPGQAMEPDEALARLSLSDLRDKMPDQLSGGQMQRVALARALVTRPKVLFADEPTGQLDHDTAISVMVALLAALDGSDTALVIATHDPSVAEFMNERWNMEAGKLSIHQYRNIAS